MTDYCRFNQINFRFLGQLVLLRQIPWSWQTCLPGRDIHWKLHGAVLGSSFAGRFQWEILACLLGSISGFHICPVYATHLKLNPATLEFSLTKLRAAMRAASDTEELFDLKDGKMEYCYFILGYFGTSSVSHIFHEMIPLSLRMASVMVWGKWLLLQMRRNLFRRRGL